MPIDLQLFTDIQQQALGLNQAKLCALPCGSLLHQDAIPPFLQLQRDAQQAGFDMQIVSSYRNFEKQLAIFNAKASGKRVLLDDHSQALDFNSLSDEQCLWAILRWTAIPGGSRHHFGSDVDIYDAKKMQKSCVQLVPEEVQGAGPMVAMHDWLDKKIAANESYGFFRPYQNDVGAIAPERWHISFAPVADALQQELNKTLLEALYSQVDCLLKPQLLANLDDIMARFVETSPLNKPNWLV